MRHAGQAALARIEPVLAELRALDGIREKSRGVFYRGASAFLHFHEDPAGIFADIKIAGEFTRIPVNTRAEIETLIRRARCALKA